MYLRPTRQRRKHGPDAISAYGVLEAAHALGEEWGIGPLLREKLQQDGCQAPHDTALFAMTANRLARPSSKLACYEHWRADDVYWPEARPPTLEPRSRALDSLLHPIAALEREIFGRTADLFNAEGDLVFW